MNKRERMTYARTMNTLREWGFTRDEAEALIRISNALRRWFISERTGNIQRDEMTGKPMYCPHPEKGDEGEKWKCRDNEMIDRTRLSTIMKSHDAYVAYVQPDPRGCALYIIPREKLADGASVGSVYRSRGFAICMD